MRYAAALALLLATTVWLFVVLTASGDAAGPPGTALPTEVGGNPPPGTNEAIATPPLADPSRPLPAEVTFLDGLFDVSRPESALVATIELSGDERATAIEVGSLRLCLGANDRCTDGPGGAKVVAVTDRDNDGLPELLVAFDYQGALALVRGLRLPGEAILTVTGTTTQQPFAGTGTVTVVDGTNPALAAVVATATLAPTSTAVSQEPPAARVAPAASPTHVPPTRTAVPPPTATPVAPTSTPLPPPALPAVLPDTPTAAPPAPRHEEPRPSPPSTVTPAPQPTDTPAPEATATPVPEPKPTEVRPPQPAPEPTAAPPPKTPRERDDDRNDDRDDEDDDDDDDDDREDDDDD